MWLLASDGFARAVDDFNLVDWAGVFSLDQAAAEELVRTLRTLESGRAGAMGYAKMHDDATVALLEVAALTKVTGIGR